VKDSKSPSAAGRQAFEASILDGLADPVILLDRDGRAVSHNLAARQLFGADVVGPALGGFLKNPEVSAALAAVLRGEGRQRSEVALPSPVARSYELTVWELPVEISGGEVWAVLVLHDVTSAKNAERMRADFVSNVSHELRSPLSSLMGFIETLRGPARGDAEATERFLGIMEAEAKRMTRLINDLLTLSKVESGEHIWPEGTVDLVALLKRVSQIVSVRAKERGTRIAIDAPDSLPPVVGDADELTQVFQNLIDNAISYGSPGTPIRVAVRPLAELPGIGGAGLSVAVANRGEGIPAQDIDRVTERFYRVDKGRSRSMGGTGLGLAIVKHIIGRHRGRLKVESTPGEETILTVFLPRAG
jgi:two-component system phosphate regulon sensor histidine kinase PhoR